MLQLPMLMKVTSAAVAAAITASISYGQYAVASGPKGSGLMPPANMFVPSADPATTVDPVAELMRAFSEMKLEKAKSERTRAMIDWLVSLQAQDLAGFSVRRVDGGLVYDVRFDRVGDGEPALIYLAVPFGTELPYAVRLVESGNSLRVEGVSCSRRDALSDMAGKAERETAESFALEKASAYLGAPETADPMLAADCLMVALSAD
ncbi:MAG: hypothetical protein R3C13_04385 [Hyphomonas sp.]|uniref:hypothetical protein n=1 Tax=Hyphomonas sp. TaxID=87 RepID=UPI0035297CD2